jgi:hypothetical protein
MNDPFAKNFSGHRYVGEEISKSEPKLADIHAGHHLHVFASCNSNISIGFSDFNPYCAHAQGFGFCNRSRIYIIIPYCVDSLYRFN